MSQAKARAAAAELDGGGPVTPSWGRWASGSCPPLRRTLGWWGRADPARCPAAGLPLPSGHPLPCARPDSRRGSTGTAEPLRLPGSSPLSPASPGALGSCPGPVDAAPGRTPALSRGVRGAAPPWERCMALPEPLRGALPGCHPGGSSLPAPPQGPGSPRSPRPGAPRGRGGPVSPCRRVAAAWRGCVARAPCVP